MRRFLALFRRPGLDTLIARRALRVGNRQADVAARYERVHLTLARGRK